MTEKIINSGTTGQEGQSLASKFARGVIRARWIVIVLCIAATVSLGVGVRNLEELSNYRAFFSPQNPELQEFDAFQATYSKQDNFFFLVKPVKGDVFNKDVLAAIEELTELGWQIPFATRVDSLTNFQHTYVTGDDLIVEDLVREANTLSLRDIAEKKKIVLNEPLIRDFLVTKDGLAAGVNVSIRLKEKSVEELPAAVTAANELRDKIKAKYPGIDIHISGLSALNSAFAKDGPEAIASLVPIMFLSILILAAIFLRSITATAAMLVVIMLSTIVAMGLAGTFGQGISPVSAAAPIVILTLAVVDVIHIFISMRDSLASGTERRAALVEAVRTNVLAITVTSVTTIVGFLALNFSEAPPFRAFGNISAMGIGAAWVFSLTLFPALLSFVSYKTSSKTQTTTAMTKLANFVIGNYRKLFFASLGVCIVMVSFIPSLQTNDMFVEYFDERVEFRRDTDAVIPHFGPLSIEYSVPAPGPGGVSEPAYLSMLDNFVDYLRQYPKVTHVYALPDIMKRLNRNMHDDDAAFYGIPENRDLSAQYLLLYELSLPYGLDLNDRINIDKSASRVSISVSPLTTQETKTLLADVDTWFTKNAPKVVPTSASVQTMFTYIADRNMQSMITGTIIAIVAISIIMMLALRSFGLGLLSLIPNALPILSAFGAWSILVGEVGFSVAMVASISLGIIVDDTVHFLIKYNLARRERGMDAEAAIRHTFERVGTAILLNSTILTTGFLILTYASFKPTVDMGLLTALSIMFALFFDFFLLPALLLWAHKRRDSVLKLERI